jgi:hypothetical protein
VMPGDDTCLHSYTGVAYLTLTLQNSIEPVAPEPSVYARFALLTAACRTEPQVHSSRPGELGGKFAPCLMAQHSARRTYATLGLIFCLRRFQPISVAATASYTNNLLDLSFPLAFARGPAGGSRTPGIRPVAHQGYRGRTIRMRRTVENPYLQTR